MSNRAVIALVGAVAACAPIEGAPDASFERSEPVEIWHVDDDGVAHVIAVPSSGVPTHMAHGDWTNPIHVDPAAAPGGNGLPETPLRRLTDAVAAAAAMRAAGPTDPITILAAPGTYTGTFSAPALAAHPELEILPVWIDTPGVALLGSTEVVVDADGIPSGDVVPGTESRLRSDAVLTVPLVLVSDSTHADGTTSVGDDVTVAGWVFDSGNTTGNGSGYGLISLRVEGLVVADIVARRFSNALNLGSSEAAISGLYAVTSNSCTVCLLGGAIEVTDSRIQDGLLGVILAPGAQGNPVLIGLNTGRTVTPLAGTAHDVSSLRIDGSDLTGHKRSKFSTGIRIIAVGTGVAPFAQSTTVNVEVSDTKLGNSPNGITMDAGFPDRNFLGMHTAVDVTLRDNDYGAFSQAPIAVTFTRIQTAVGETPPGSAPYLRDSDWSLSLEGSDESMLSALWIDTPVTDPYGDDTILDNDLLVEGVPVPAPVCQGAWPATTCPL